VKGRVKVPQNLQQCKYKNPGQDDSSINLFTNSTTKRFIEMKLRKRITRAMKVKSDPRASASLDVSKELIVNRRGLTSHLLSTEGQKAWKNTKQS
jgi:hypothetical protein